MSNRCRLFLLACTLGVIASNLMAFEVIVDNSDAGFSSAGSWTLATSNCYGANLIYRTSGTGTNLTTWTATVPPGWYRVDFHTGSNTTWATDAHYTITHRDGRDAITASQRQSAAGFYYLGTFYFDGTATVGMTDQFSVGARVVADAMRFQSVFSFVQMSDSHVGYTLGTSDLALIADQLSIPGKVQMTPYGFDAPPPAFAIHCGDTTEYGQEYWDTLTGTLSRIPYPVYITLGNHDVTQNCNREKLRARQGGPYMSFDYTDGGTRYHFVMFESGIIQSPRASFAREALDWLATDLAGIPQNTCVFPVLHHPINGASDPKPYDSHRLMEVLHKFNVPIIFDGHGHSYRNDAYDNLQLVQGGCTYGGSRGYNIITVTNGKVHVARKLYDEPNASLGLMDSLQIAATVAYPSIGVSMPPKDFVNVGASMTVSASISGASVTAVSAAACELDGDGNWRPLTGTGFGPYGGPVDLSAAPHGRHWVRVRFTADAGRLYYKMVPFWNWDGYPKPRWIFDMGATSLSTPAVAGGKVFVGCNGGAMRCIDALYGTELWRRDLPADIVSAPAVSNDKVVFGCGDGKVYCLDTTSGAVLWTSEVSGPVYAPPVIADNAVYVGSTGTGAPNSAALYKLDILSGTIGWSFPVQCAIESRPCVSGNTVFVGAWDSYFYAVDTNTGAQKWRYRRNSSRYYSPADSWPVVSPSANRVFVADREYVMNAINITTGLADWTAAGVGSQALTSDGSALLQRLSAGNLAKTDFSNGPIWSVPCSLDSTPVSPSTFGSMIATVDLDGLAQVLDGAGNLSYAFQVAQGYQLNPVTLGEDNCLFATTYDGFVICVANQDPPAKTLPDVVIESMDAAGNVAPLPGYRELPGAWSTSTAKSAAVKQQAGKSRFHSFTDGVSGSVQITPSLPHTALYDVYATWNTSSNAKNVSCGIRSKAGLSTVTLTQRPGGSIGGSNCNIWNHLGRFEFPAGQNTATGSVTMDESTVTGPYNDYNTGRTYADGFLFSWVQDTPARVTRWELE